MKKIIFDSRWIGDHGIGRFAREVFNGIEGMERIGINGAPTRKLDSIWLSLYLLKKNCVFFSPGYNSPLFFSKKTIITVHDLNHVDINYNSSFLKRLYYRVILKRACLKSYRVFTVSDFSKKRIVEWSGIQPEKVIVVGNGVSDAFNDKVIPYQTDMPYIVIPGNRKAHKNENLAIKAFANSSLALTHKVLMTGYKSPDIDGEIKSLGIEDRVVFLGRVTDELLASVYKGAAAILFPSLYEGFGLPVVEAMSCGTPVITSKTTSLGEISGDAAFLIDPSDLNEMTSALEQVCFNVELRNSLINKGYHRSKSYTWIKTIDAIKKELVDFI